MANPFDALTSGLQSVAMLEGIRARRDERALNELRLLSELQKIDQANKEAELKVQAIQDLHTIFSSDLFQYNPSAMLGPVASALARLGEPADIEKLGKLFNDLTQMNKFQSLNDALAAFDSGDVNGLVDALVRYHRVTTGIPWNGTITNANNKGITLTLTAPTEDGSILKRQMVVNYDTLLRLATAASTQPSQFAEGMVSLQLAPGKLDLMSAQAFQARAEGVRDLAEADKTRTEKYKIEVLLPLEKAVAEANAVVKSVEASSAALDNRLAIGSRANEFGKDLLKRLSETVPELSGSAKIAISNFGSAAMMAELSGEPINALMETTVFAQMKADNELKNKPFQGFKIERGVILSKNQEMALKKAPPEQRGKMMDVFVENGQAKEIYLYTSPSVTRAPVSPAFAKTILNILGPQFRLSNDPVPVLQSEDGSLRPSEEWKFRPAAEATRTVVPGSPPVKPWSSKSPFEIMNAP